MLSLALAGLVAAATAAQAEPPAAPADAPAQTPEERRKLEEEIAKELGQPPATAAAPAPAAESAPAASVPWGRLLLMPELAAVGRFALAWSNRDIETLSPRSGPFGPEDRPTPLFEEVELSLQAFVDPYLRGDVFVAFTPDEVEVEEAYVTTLRLPAGFQVRAGTLFSPFGRQNQQHPHVREFVDAPLAPSRLVAPESLGGPGLDVAWLAPVPWFAEVHLALQSLSPVALDAAPEEVEEERLGGVLRLVQFFNVRGASAFGVGVSAAHLREGGGGAYRQLGGVDLYVKIRPPAGRAYLSLQGEVFARRVGGVDDQPARAGAYAQAVWRQGSFFTCGARYEYAPAATGEAEHRVSALAGWLPSEFQRLRLQFALDRLPGGMVGVETLLHLEFSMGAHGAHPF